MTQIYSFRIDYFDAQGNLQNFEIRETPLDQWDLCVHLFDNLAEGIANFHISDLAPSYVSSLI